MRPLAWAASIGLCVAVVLQVYLTQSPALRPDVTPDSAMDLHEAAVESRARKLGDTHRGKAGHATSFADTVDSDATSQPAETICPANFQLARDEWLRCIASLEDAGEVEQAAIERERLERAHAGEGAADD